MKNEEKEKMINDYKYCIEQFKKAKCFILADLKQKELENFIKNN